MIESLLQGTQLQKLYNQKIDALRSEYHLCKIDIDILYFLYKSGNQNTPKDISRLNLFNKGHISQSIDRMEKQGLITVVQDQHDRRCVHLFLTEQAKAIIGRITDLRTNMYHLILRGITEEERTLLMQISKKVHENIRDALEFPTK